MLRLVLNILWFILGGWISMLLWLLAGVLLAITIVGLPWTAAAFRIAGFTAAPFGKQVLPKDTAAFGFGGGPLDALLNIV